MPKKSKIEKARLAKAKTLFKVDPSLPSLENDPYFLKKAADARTFLEKHPLPKEFFDPSTFS